MNRQRSAAHHVYVSPHVLASRSVILEERATNTNVILRRTLASASGRLEGWPQTPSLLPSFETPAYGRLLRMTVSLLRRPCTGMRAGRSPVREFPVERTGLGVE